jgi:hypothetical protein
MFIIRYEKRVLDIFIINLCYQSNFKHCNLYILTQMFLFSITANRYFMLVTKISSNNEE